MDEEIHSFEQLQREIMLQCQILKEKQEAIDSNQSRVDSQAVWAMESWSATDSISNLEDNLIRERKNQYRIDMKIVSLYLKVLSLQSAKISFFLSRLHKFNKKNDFQGMPDYTIQSYQEWLHTDPKVHALQSEILDLLSQKLKDSERLHQNVFLKANMNQKLDIQMLRSQTFFLIEKDPLLDSEFSNLVSEITSIASPSFEGIKMREFIQFCWNKNDSQILYNNCYHEFVGALSEHIMTKYGHLCRSSAMQRDITRDQIYGIIEGHLIPHISQQVFSKSPFDILLHKQYEHLSKLTLKEIGVKPCYIDPSVCPYKEAIVKLKKLEIAKLPTQKMRFLILAAQAIMNKMASLDQASVTSADEFMDVLVYVTIQARIKKLFSNIQFLRNFSNPSYMLSETGYYLASLELAAEYIKTMKLNDFKQENEIVFVLYDSDKLKLSHSLKLFEVVEELYELVGYEAYVVMEWLTLPSRLSCGVLRKNSYCSTIVSKWKVKCDIVTLTSVLLKDSKTFAELVLIEDFYVPVFNNNVPEHLTLIRMSSSFDCCKNNLIKYSNLIHLNVAPSVCTSDFHSIETELKCMTDEFEVEFYPFLRKKHNGVDSIIALLQNALSAIYMCSVTNIVLWKLVKRFQLQYNALHDTFKKLRDDGICDSRTLRAILEKNKQLS
ncbi:uncharacterized protein LOC101239998 [Hydra vulgaris]|uniref:uncharacterized protein LOC101239998 n=1 Tax=Hydra vulgaris TaxID=6087 RepID=UPI001F5F2F5C|nr:uncharacterized protein LOC101239998 isoform X2 [Hydra vulgaris]